MDHELIVDKQLTNEGVVMTSLLQDARYGLRMLLKHKGFTAVAALTLALGIGVNTAMFSVLNTFLFRSLPYPQSSQLVRVFRTSPHSQSWPHSPGNFFDQRERNTVFEKMAACNPVGRNLVEQGHMTERVLGLAGAADFFPLLGVAPARGRVFNPEEFELGADNVIVLSDRFWQRRFGGDPSVRFTFTRTRSACCLRRRAPAAAPPVTNRKYRGGSYWWDAESRPGAVGREVYQQVPLCQLAWRGSST